MHTHPRVPATTRSKWLLLSVAVVAGLQLVFGLTSALGKLDADEAVTGLMARHVLDGEFPVFYWGQDYGGTGEVYLTAAIFSVVGSSTIGLKIVPLLLKICSAVLLWRIARRFFDDARAPLAGAVLMVFPAAFVMRSIKGHGFYGLLLVLGMALLLLVLRLDERPDSRVDVAAMGLVLGLGWWTTPQIVLIAGPALVWLVVRHPESLRLWWLAVPGLSLGAAPWLFWNVENGWRSLSLELPRENNGYWTHFPVFFQQSLPTALGLRVRGPGPWILGAVGVGVYVGVLALFLQSVRDLASRYLPLLMIAVAYPFIFSLSPWAWYGGEPRYLMLLHPVVVLLAVAALRSFTAQAIAVTLAAALTFGTLIYMEREERGNPLVSGMETDLEMDPFLDRLEALGIEHVYADYWLAYPITFASNETIVAASTSQVRYQPYQDEVAADPAAAHIFPVASAAEQVFLASNGGAAQGYTAREIGRLIVYQPDP